MCLNLGTTHTLIVVLVTFGLVLFDVNVVTAAGDGLVQRDIDSIRNKFGAFTLKSMITSLNIDTAARNREYMPACYRIYVSLRVFLVELFVL